MFQISFPYESSNTTVKSKFVKYVYDSVWAIALALRGNRLITCSTSRYYYHHRGEMVAQFVEEMESLSFAGLSVSARLRRIIPDLENFLMIIVTELLIFLCEQKSNAPFLVHSWDGNYLSHQCPMKFGYVYQSIWMYSWIHLWLRRSVVLNETSKISGFFRFQRIINKDIVKTHKFSSE